MYPIMPIFVLVNFIPPIFMVTYAMRKLAKDVFNRNNDSHRRRCRLVEVITRMFETIATAALIIRAGSYGVNGWPVSWIICNVMVCENGIAVGFSLMVLFRSIVKYVRDGKGNGIDMEVIVMQLLVVILAIAYFTGFLASSHGAGSLYLN